MDNNDHDRCVRAWIEHVASGPVARLPVVRWIDAFEAGFEALRSRADLPLGEVTLAAIARRVLWSAEERFRFLAALELDGAHLRCDRLRANPSLQADSLVVGIAFVLLEFLTVVGNLTADILTPALHAALRTAPFAPRVATVGAAPTLDHRGST